MKIYYHPMGCIRRRLMGYLTGDRDVSISFCCMGNDSDDNRDTLHMHKYSDEIYIALNGRLAIWVNGRVSGLRPGKIIKVKRGEPHRVIPLKEQASFYVIKVPDEADDKVIVETPTKLKELMERHDIKDVVYLPDDLKAYDED